MEPSSGFGGGGGRVRDCGVVDVPGPSDVSVDVVVPGVAPGDGPVICRVESRLEPESTPALSYTTCCLGSSLRRNRSGSRSNIHNPKDPCSSFP